MKTISIVTACFNEEGNVREVEASLNTAAAGTSAPAADASNPPVERGAAPVELPGASPRALDKPAAADTPQQGSLPGFERG